eukprot:gene6817-30789_t
MTSSSFASNFGVEDVAVSHSTPVTKRVHNGLRRRTLLEISPPPPPPPPPSPYYACLPCRAGTWSSEDVYGSSGCVSCGPGKTSSGLGGPCFDVQVPLINITIQRDVIFRFNGGDSICVEFFKSATQVDNFNETITKAIYANSVANVVWPYKFTCGSNNIVVDVRLTFDPNMSSDVMGSNVKKLVDSAGTMFGDISRYGITSVGYINDDDENSLAIDVISCGPGKISSVLGGPCFDVKVPLINLTIQREVIFKFNGGDSICVEFFKSATQVDQFNKTITKAIYASSVANYVWPYKFTCGSNILVDVRLTFDPNMSSDVMDSNVNKLVDSAGTMFGNLSGYGITSAVYLHLLSEGKRTQANKLLDQISSLESISSLRSDPPSYKWQGPPGDKAPLALSKAPQIDGQPVIKPITQHSALLSLLLNLNPNLSCTSEAGAVRSSADVAWHATNDSARGGSDLTTRSMDLVLRGGEQQCWAGSSGMQVLSTPLLHYNAYDASCLLARVGGKSEVEGGQSTFSSWYPFQDISGNPVNPFEAPPLPSSAPPGGAEALALSTSPYEEPGRPATANDAMSWMQEALHLAASAPPNSAPSLIMIGGGGPRSSPNPAMANTRLALPAADRPPPRVQGGGLGLTPLSLPAPPRLLLDMDATPGAWTPFTPPGGPEGDLGSDEWGAGMMPSSTSASGWMMPSSTSSIMARKADGLGGGGGGDGGDGGRQLVLMPPALDTTRPLLLPPPISVVQLLEAQAATLESLPDLIQRSKAPPQAPPLSQAPPSMGGRAPQAVTLIDLVLHMGAIHSRLQLLADLCRCTRVEDGSGQGFGAVHVGSTSELPPSEWQLYGFPSGVQLLSYLYGEMMMADASQLPMLRPLFCAAFRPYMAHLRGWVFTSREMEPWALQGNLASRLCHLSSLEAMEVQLLATYEGEGQADTEWDSELLATAGLQVPLPATGYDPQYGGGIVYPLLFRLEALQKVAGALSHFAQLREGEVTRTLSLLEQALSRSEASRQVKEAAHAAKRVVRAQLLKAQKEAMSEREARMKADHDERIAEEQEVLAVAAAMEYAEARARLASELAKSNLSHEQVTQGLVSLDWRSKRLNLASFRQALWQGIEAEELEELRRVCIARGVEPGVLDPLNIFPPPQLLATVPKHGMGDGGVGSLDKAPLPQSDAQAGGGDVQEGEAPLGPLNSSLTVQEPNQATGDGSDVDMMDVEMEECDADKGDIGQGPQKEDEGASDHVAETEKEGRQVLAAAGARIAPRQRWGSRMDRPAGALTKYDADPSPLSYHEFRDHNSATSSATPSGHNLQLQPQLQPELRAAGLPSRRQAAGPPRPGAPPVQPGISEASGSGASDPSNIGQQGGAPARGGARRQLWQAPHTPPPQKSESDQDAIYGLRRGKQDHEWDAAEGEELLAPVSSALEVCVSAGVRSHYRLTTSAFWEVALGELRLMDFYAGLKRYFFMEAGDFAHLFTDGLISALAQHQQQYTSSTGGTSSSSAGGPSTSVSSRWLTPQSLSIIVDEARSLSSCAQDPHAACISAKLLPGRSLGGHWGASPKGSKGPAASSQLCHPFECVVLTYDVQWPMGELLPAGAAKQTLCHRLQSTWLALNKPTGQEAILGGVGAVRRRRTRRGQSGAPG